MAKKGPPFKIIPDSIVKGSGQGYMVCQTDPVHPHSIKLPDRDARYMYVHIVVMENKLGRLLKDGEEVDHIDEDKSNNAPSNLRLRFLGDHQRSHAKKNKMWKDSPRTKKNHGKRVAGLFLEQLIKTAEILRESKNKSGTKIGDTN